MIEDVILTKLKIIDVPGGDVLRGMRKDDIGFAGFAEAYFSEVKEGAVKAWKRHRNMTLNLIVPIGSVKFVFFERVSDCKKISGMREVVLSRTNYCRLTVPPMIWFGFVGLASGSSILLNLANIQHSAEEVDRLSVDEVPYKWEP